MRLVPFLETFHRNNFRAAALHAQHQTGKNGLAIYQNRASPTLSKLTPVLGAGQAHVLAQHFEQRFVDLGGNLFGLSVDPQAKQPLGRSITSAVLFGFFHGFLQLKKSPGFELKPRQRAGSDILDLRPQSQTLAKPQRDELLEGAGRSAIGPRLDDEFQLAQFLAHESLDFELLDLRKLSHNIFNCAREDVDAAHDDHIISPAQDTAPQEHKRAPAGAGLETRFDQIAGAVADHRTAVAAEIGHDELAPFALLGRPAPFRIDHPPAILVPLDMDSPRP